MEIRLNGCGRRGAIMTGGAVIRNSAVIEHRCGKGSGDMTDTAVLFCRYMSGMFLGNGTRLSITMTGGTVTGDTGMIKGHAIRKGGAGAMADTAVSSGFRVGGGGGYFARGPCGKVIAIMTGGTVLRDTVMAKDMWQEAGVAMAEMTVLFGRDMADRVFYEWRRRQGQETTVMAALTATRHVRMHIG